MDVEKITLELRTADDLGRLARLKTRYPAKSPSQILRDAFRAYATGKGATPIGRRVAR